MNGIIAWYDIVFVLLAVGVVAYAITANKAKEWLKWAVMVAEQELGSGTGQAKLHMVYDMFIEKFPAIASVLSFNIFSKWVDVALEWMREQLDKNENIRVMIEG